MLYVTDSHTLIWYVLDKLPEKVNKIFESARKGELMIFVPTIVLVECLYLAEKDKIDLEFDTLMNRIRMEKNFKSISLDIEIIELLPEIEIEDPHDKIIVATAKMLNAALITRDRKIKKAGIVQVVWQSD